MTAGIFMPAYIPAERIPVVSFLGSGGFNSGSAVATFTATVNLGTADPDRLIVVAVTNAGESARYPASMSFAGTPLSLQATVTSHQTGSYGFGVLRGAGGSGTLSVPLNSGTDRGGYAIFAITGRLKSDTPTLTKSTTWDGNNLTRTVNAPVKAGGVLIASALNRGFSPAWTNATVHANPGFEAWNASYASRNSDLILADATLTLTATQSRSAVAAVWR